MKILNLSGHAHVQVIGPSNLAAALRLATSLQQGQIAAGIGKTPADCPYPQGERRLDWFEGFNSVVDHRLSLLEETSE